MKEVEIDSSVSSYVLSVRHLSKKYDKNLVLKNINIDIKEKEIYGIIGQNGAGKSTFLKALVGATDVDSGDIFINGKKIGSRSISLKHKFGYASQNNCFYPDLSIEENLKYFGTLFWIPKKVLEKRIHEIIHYMGLSEFKNVLARDLSGGIQRKLDLACAVIHSPEILILDEPTAELDPISSKHIWELVHHINKLGTTIILTSHILEDVEHICSKISILHEGEVVKTGSPLEIKSYNMKNNSCVVLETFPPNYKRIIEVLEHNKIDFVDYTISNNEFNVFSKEPEKLFPILLKIVKLVNQKVLIARIDKPDLKDVYEVILKDYDKKKSKERKVKDDDVKLKDAKDFVNKKLEDELKLIRKELKKQGFSDEVIKQVVNVKK
jgi:ABC-2 type transport system ATP-binding protein